jgi:hypothetical protein
MTKKILITPGIADITFSDTSVQTARIYESNTDLYLNATGNIVFGDGTPANVELGNSATAVSIDFLGGGDITSSGNSLALGIAGDTVNLNVTGVTYNFPSNLVTTSDLTPYATQSYVISSVNSLVAAAPGSLDTLNELAAALGDDPTFATTVTNSIATKLPLAGGTLTGTLNYRNLIDQTITNYDTAGDSSGFSVFYATSAATNRPAGTDHAVTTLAYNDLWQIQEAGDWRTNARYIRKQENGTWSSWQRIFADDYHPNADTWTTARTITLGGVLSGSTSIDGSGNVTLTAAHTSDPVITLTGAVTGSGTMTNLGSVSIATTATADPVLTLAGDATGSATFTNLGNATLTVAIADDSHNHVISNVDGLQTELDSKQRVYRATTALISNAGFVNVFNVVGSLLASAIRFTVHGTANAVVVNVTGDLLANHSGDILLTTYSGFYTQLTIKVQSNFNETFSVLMSTNSATAATFSVEVFPLNSESVTFGGTATTASSTLTHIAYFGTHTSGTGGNSGDFRSAGALTTAGAATFGGNVEFNGYSPTVLYDFNSIGAVTSADSLAYFKLGSGISTGIDISATPVITTSWSAATGTVYANNKFRILAAKGNYEDALSTAGSLSVSGYGDTVIIGNVDVNGTNTKLTAGLGISGNEINLVGDVTTSGAATFGGAVTFNGSLNVTGQQRSNIVAVAALDVNCGLGNYFTKTISGNSTFTFSNVPATSSYSFILELTHTSGTVTWPASVQWPNSSTPSLTTGKTHLFVFITDDAGARWRGSSSINYVS